jgi:Holliday junction resolvase-like predicted endonuclease
MIDQPERLGPDSNTLKLWADMYQQGAFRTSLPSRCWQAADELLGVALAADCSARAGLEEILAISDQTFSPLADPLSIEFGAHRWLSSEREESYSDWLGWILEQIKDASQVLKLLGVHDEELLRGCASENPIVKREFRIPGGRLDLSVEFGKHLLVIVEIKTKSFDEDAVLEQLKKYSRWAQNQPQSTRCYFAAVESGEFACPEWIEPLPWRELALRIREQARNWIQASTRPPLDGRDLIRAAMTLAFCGAVEQNLLRLSGKPGRFRAQPSAEYLKEWSAKHAG